MTVLTLVGFQFTSLWLWFILSFFVPETKFIVITFSIALFRVFLTLVFVNTYM